MMRRAPRKVKAASKEGVSLLHLNIYQSYFLIKRHQRIPNGETENQSTMHGSPQYGDTQDMMLRLANDAQHDVRPAKTASGRERANRREACVALIRGQKRARRKEEGKNKVHNTMICSEIKVVL